MSKKHESQAEVPFDSVDRAALEQHPESEPKAKSTVHRWEDVRKGAPRPAVENPRAIHFSTEKDRINTESQTHVQVSCGAMNVNTADAKLLRLPKPELWGWTLDPAQVTCPACKEKEKRDD